MSTQQALGVVGGVVGFFFGYPQLGFVVGSLVGGLLTPKEKIEGPRVEDLKVQVSTYGAGIPVISGNGRAGGNVVDSTDKIEVENTEDVGKGGGAESTTYRYFVRMAICLCETPADGSLVSIRKIWQDGKLIYDASTGIPIMSAIASAENPNAFLVLYQGHEDQLPDPIEEIQHGIGNVPAYRGVVRVRLNNVECPGGRVPQFSFEVCVGADYVVDKREFVESLDFVPAFVQKDGIFGMKVESDEITVSYTNGNGSQTVRKIDIGPLYSGSYTPMIVNGAERPQAMMAYRAAFADDNHVRIIDLESGDMSYVLSTPNTYETEGGFPVAGGQQGNRAAYDPINTRYAATSGGSGGVGLSFFWSGPLVEADSTGLDYTSPIAFVDGVLYALGLNAGTLEIRRINSMTGDQLTPIPGPTLAGANLDGSAITSNKDGVFVFVFRTSGNESLVYSISEAGSWDLLCDDASFLGTAAVPSLQGTSNWICNQHTTIVGPNVDGQWTFIRFQVIAPASASVAAIIADQCRRAGLTPEQIDIDGIDDTIHGYTLANPASARSNLQPLMTAFAIDATEEDGKLKFFKRSSKSSVATILYEELGTVEGDSEAGDPMPLTRAQNAELPRSVSASYTNKDFDYQTGTEKAIRQIFDSQNDMMVDLAMSTTSDHAATVAQAILYDSHNDRNKRSLKVSRKYAFLSAGDVFTVEYPVTVLSDWRIVQITDTGALIEIECVPFDSAIYTQTAAGATGYTGQTVAPLPPPTRLQILDIPILRDQDDNAGIYTAMSGFGPGWPGGYLQTWDDPATIENRGAVEREAPIGFAETVLADWTSGIVDESNLLTVNVGHSELNSISYEALLTGTSNVAAIGAPGRWEIIKFRTAASLGDGRYILSGLMRGQRGTEWARGTHSANDTFVLLSMAGMLRPNFDAGSIGQTKTYRAVTKGRSPASAATQTYANTAEGLETFSPTNLDKSVSGSDITLTVVRRTRLSENWLRGIVPLGEDAERFEFELFTDGTFSTSLRVIASSTRAAVYTAAMQTEDGYTSGPLYVRVYQLSGVVGRGRALQETI